MFHSFEISPESSEAEALYYHPSNQDVYTVRNFLLSLEILPLEIVDIILEEARYWPRVVTEREVTLSVAASSSDKADNAAWCYLVASPILERYGIVGKEEGLKITTVRQLRQVKFVFESHDQGFGSQYWNIFSSCHDDTYSL